MYQQQYVLPKDSGTLTDTLIAFGFAELIEEIVRRSTGTARVVLSDQGSCFVVDAGVAIQPSWIEQLAPFSQLPFLTSSKVNAPSDLPQLAIRDVDAEWDRFRSYTEQRKHLSDQKIAGDELENMLADLKPRPDWTVVTYLGDYRMQAQGIYNELVEQWERSAETLWSLNLRTLLSLFASLHTDREAIIAAWKKAAKATGLVDTVTASQLFNPHMGKGQNRSKANGLSMGNEKNFWLLEYLKAVGLWSAAAPRNATNANLRKTYLLAPQQLVLQDHRAIFNRFRDLLWNSTSIKMDIQAALLYTEALLEYSAETEQLNILSTQPLSQLVAGMHVATYQLLSQNSYTMMNLSFLGLPDWMPRIENYRIAKEYQGLIREHRERINSIDEEKSEGHRLLQAYRDFVAANDLHQFFAFSASYSNYLISAIERSNFYVKPFGEEKLERLLAMTKPELTPILQSQGFRNIADAIRRSTVIPQYLGRKTSHFEVRYGLGQDLKRSAKYADAFIQALADFMQSYNEENARVFERTKGQARRKAITVSDIEEITRLIDTYGSETICNLLVAFGYARDPKERIEEANGEPATTEATV